jgi:phosphoribosylformylglycinamidine synthase
MTPYEIMLSESQERMLLVVKQGREAEVEQIFEKWDLHAVRIGSVTDDGLVRVRHRGAVVAELPIPALTDEAPVYRRPMERPAYLDDVAAFDLDARAAAQPLPAPADALLRLLAVPTIASKEWIYRQYDHMVQTNTINLPGLGAGVVRVKGTDRALAMSVDGNSRYCYLDPKRGAMLAVAEAARNVACAGGRPLGATNCLNFGNPERPGIMWQFGQAVAGIGEACRALDVPITGGNVSLYNETDGRAINPTPVIGVVGLLDHADRVLGRRFQSAGDAVILLGTGLGELGASEYAQTIMGVTAGAVPALDLSAERALQQLLVALATERLARSAHDCSDGGLAVSLAECCFGSGLGVDVSIEPVAVAASSASNDAAALFGESATRAVVSTRSGDTAAVLERAAALGVPACVIGQTGGTQLRIAVGGRYLIDVAVAQAEQVWSSTIARVFERSAA